MDGSQAQKQRQQHLLELSKQQQPPSELVFANQTGAVVQCGVALELAKSIARAEHPANKPTSKTADYRGEHELAPGQQQSSFAGYQLSAAVAAVASNAYLTSGSPNQRAADAPIEIRWEKENGEEVEQMLYAQNNDDSPVGPLSQVSRQQPLRFQRPTDGALVFEPFKPADFRPDVHATTYRCVASSSSRGASVVSRDMRVRASLVGQTSQIQVEVLDQLVVEGGSAVFRCQIPSHALDYLQVLDWVESPGELVHSFQSTTLENANHLFHPTSSLAQQQQQQQSQHVQYKKAANGDQIINAQNRSISRYFVAPKSGDLHIVDVDIGLNYRAFKCRCKNKLTGELISSVNKGKLIVSESHSPMAPRIIAEIQQQAVYEEGELSLLACNMQSFSRASISWFKRLNDLESEPIEMDHIKFAQVAGLLLINRVSRNDSGFYQCQVKNLAGEERLELELLVRAGLKAKLSTSASVLELGKSLALECTVRGHPIHQVVFRHNGRVIKSISGGQTSGSNDFHSQRHMMAKQQWQQSQVASSASGSYFVVNDNNANGNRPFGRLSKSSKRADDNANQQLEQQTAADISGQLRLQTGGSGDLAANSNELAADDNNKANEIKLSHVIVIVLEPQHAGAYQCFAYNQYESVQSSAYIRVLDDPPKFKDTFKAEVFEQRQDVSLQCSARANPLPEITWSVDDQAIPETGRIRFGDFVAKDNLVISYVNISQTQVVDSGLYRCTADNGLAQVSHQAQISVLGPLQIKPMPNVTVVASTTFKVRCPVAGFPLTEIQWQHNGRRLPANHRQHVYENGTLEVEHMEKSQGDDGEYTCVASAPAPAPSASLPIQLDEANLVDRRRPMASAMANSGAAPNHQVYGSLHVSIKVRPTIEPFTISRSLREGQRASIICTISSGDLPISISWFRNDQLLSPLLSPSAAGTVQMLLPGEPLNAPQVTGSGEPIQELRQVDGSGQRNASFEGLRISRGSDYSSTLFFESLSPEHSANYTCLARNDAGQVSHQAPMIVQVAPKWLIEPADTNIVRGTAISIDCMAAGFPPARIIWTKALVEQSAPVAGVPQQQQQSTSANNAKSHHHHHHLGNWVYENGSLNILDARDSDFGHYMCQASNGVGPGLSKVIKVTINVAAQFTGRHSVQYVAKGEQAHLKCQAKGDYPITIHWFKNRNRLELINPQNSAMLSVGQPLLSGGSAAHSLSAASSQQSLISSTIGSVLLLPASAGSLPTAPPLQLGPDGRQRNSAIEQLNAHLAGGLGHRQDQLQENSNDGRKQQGVLMQKYSLANTELALSGTRSATMAGQAVDGAPTISGIGQQPLVAQISSLMSISQSDRQDTATFKCYAANQFGFDERTIQLIVQEVPDRVEELSVLEASSRSVTLAWLAPYDGNTPITSYHIQYRPSAKVTAAAGGHLPISDQQPLIATSEHLGETPNWLNYTFQASGNGGASNDSGSLQQYSSGALATIAAAAAARLGSEAPSSGSGTLVKLAIQSLRPVTHYWFRVQAENKLGLSSVSNLVEAITIEEAPGAAPTKLKAVAQSSSSILVSWSRVNEKEVFGSVNGYYVAYKPLPGETIASSPAVSVNQTNAKYSFESTFSASEQSTPSPVTNIYKTIQHDDKLTKFDALLSGLKRNTKYMISVQAFNNRGTGPSTEPIVLRTLDMDPPRQVKLYVKQSTNCSLQLEWRPMSQAALVSYQQAQLDKESGTGTGTGRTASHILPLAMPLLGAGNSISNDNQVNGKQMVEADVVDYYNLYQAELNDRPRWQELRLPGHLSSRTVEGLRCGTRYQFYMMGVNRIGVGDQSDILDTKTLGGLPLAPDRQSTFDVINTTCYTIRLDHWQDNGCPIREFNIRFRQEQARDWNQLAHYNLMANEPDDAERSVSGGSTPNRVAIDSVAGRPSKQLIAQTDMVWPVKQPTRARRSVEWPSEGSLMRFKRFIDKDDVFVFANDNENIDTNEHANDGDDDTFFDYSAESNADFEPDYNNDLTKLFMPDAFDQTQSSLVNSSSLIRVSSDQGNKLISLLKDSMLPTFVDSGSGDPSAVDQVRRSSSGLLKLAAPVAQGWNTADFFENSQLGAGNSQIEQANKQGQQRQVSGDLQHQLTNNMNSQDGPRTSIHSAARQSSDWRRVRFCNLIENRYYSVQITALNSVGETEAELRLLTSQEGLEYDQSIKRQVVGKLDGGDRMAQSAMGANGDHFNLFMVSNFQWQVLVTSTIIVALFVVLIALALRRSNPSGGSTSTSTTTASSSGSENHCHNYLNSEHNVDSSPFKQQANSIDTTTNNIMYSGGDGGGPRDGYALTAPRLNGFSSLNGTMTMYQPHRSNHPHSMFGGIEEPAYGAIFYGVAAPQGANNVYGHHSAVQVRHFQPQQQHQQPDESQQTTNKETANTFLSSQPMFQPADEMYAGGGGPTQAPVNATCESGEKQLGNCFMSIVDEVARDQQQFHGDPQAVTSIAQPNYASLFYCN